MNDHATLLAHTYGAALVADSAFRSGSAIAVPDSGLRPLNPAHRCAGPIRTVEANNDLASIIAGSHRTDPGGVLVIANRTFEVGLIGDLIGTDAAQRGLGGIIVDGCARDAEVLASLDLPVFCRATIPVGPLKLPTALKGVGQIDVPVEIGGACVESGMWAVGDRDGIVFVQAEALETIVKYAESAMARENDLLDQIGTGTALGDMLAIDEFMRQRLDDSGADFNEHLVKIGQAI